MNKTIAVIRGDGIGPEIVNEAIKVLDKIAEKYGHTFTYDDVDMGGIAIDKWGDPLPQAMLDKCLAADSVLLGAVGGPKWEGLPGPQRPEKGLLRLRAGMGLYSNLRPAKLWPQPVSYTHLIGLFEDVQHLGAGKLLVGVVGNALDLSLIHI